MRPRRRGLPVLLTLLVASWAAGCLGPASSAVHLPPDALRQRVRAEAEFILTTQFLLPGHAAHGAFNDVPGLPTWVVPRENGVAILGLLRAAHHVGGEEAERYRAAAALSANYLVRVQREDGAWADQYAYAGPVTLEASPTQTTEVLLALAALPATPERDLAMRRGAEWLLEAQSPALKTGPRADDGLVNGGTGPDGAWYREWRWASDNAFAAAAFRAAHARTGDARFLEAAARVDEGIATALADPDGPGWRRRVDGAHRPADEPQDWISYAPAFVGPAPAGTDVEALAGWVEREWGRDGGAVAWTSTGDHATRLSPGFAFQACVVWRAGGLAERCEEAVRWADGSGLEHAQGGWVDWVEPDGRAPAWQRFVDTSAYSIAARLGEYPFGAPGSIIGE